MDVLGKVLNGESCLLMDGAMGSVAIEKGLITLPEIPDLLNITNPEAVIAIHESYVKAGTQCITTNTFNTNALTMAHGSFTVFDVYGAAATAARLAGASLVAGDVGPYLFGFKGFEDFDPKDLSEIFSEQVRAAQEAGCDLILLESFHHLDIAKVALKSALDNTDLPVFITMSLMDSGLTYDGISAAEALMVLAAMGAKAVGVNCSFGPKDAYSTLLEVKACVDCLLIAQPNAGIPVIEGTKATYSIGPDEFCSVMKDILDEGATIVGGCCGTTPHHIAGLKKMLDERRPAR